MNRRLASLTTWHYTANKFIDALAKKVVTYNLVDEFPNKVIGYLDFLGINYYGEEIVTGTTVVVDGRRVQ